MKKIWIIVVSTIMTALFCSACTENKQTVEEEKVMGSSGVEGMEEERFDNTEENPPTEYKVTD